jgi:hypothetical protein
MRHVHCTVLAIRLFDKYNAQFTELRQARKLKCAPHLGIVDLELELNNGETRSFSVSPVHATIIYHFQDRGMEFDSPAILCVRACVQRCPYGSVCLLDQESWSLSDLAQELECGDSLAILRRRVNYWVQQGILRAAGGDVYELMTERPKDGQDATHKYDQDEGMV